MFFLVVCHLFHLGVFCFDEHLVRAGKILLDLLELAVLLDNFRKLGVLLGDFLVARGVGGHFGSGKLLGQLVVAGSKLVQFFIQRKNGHCSTSRVFSNQLSHQEKRKRNQVKRRFHFAEKCAPPGRERG